MKAVAKTGIVDNILVWAKVKGQELMSKKSGIFVLGLYRWLLFSMAILLCWYR